MAISFFAAGSMTKLSFLVFVICLLISVNNRNAETKKRSFSSSPSPSPPSPTTSPSATTWPPSWDSKPSIFLSLYEYGVVSSGPRSLEYDFYRDSCPQAEKVIREVVRGLYGARNSVAPALLRLVFHDCFIEGCDASVLLDPAEGVESEKDSSPNKGLRGFDIIDIVKSEIEAVCPGVVSCSDIVVLAAREAVVQAGGPFYPLYTGRRDSNQSFRDTATRDLPSPQADLLETLSAFASRGFDERETVSLLGAHSVGTIHCRFFRNRLYNFSGTNKPDPSMDPEFLNQMREKCQNRSSTEEASPPFHASPLSSPPSPCINNDSGLLSPAPSPYFSGAPGSPYDTGRTEGPHSYSAAPSLSPRGSISPSPTSSTAPTASFDYSLLDSSDEAALDMAYEGPGVDFGTLYYRSLLQGRGILYADQQLTAGGETGMWVRAYASDSSLFRRDFALAMMKLSNLKVLTGSSGQVRLNCSRIA